MLRHVKQRLKKEKLWEQGNTGQFFEGNKDPSFPQENISTANASFCKNILSIFVLNIFIDYISKEFNSVDST